MTDTLLCFDVDGTLTDGPMGPPIEGAVETIDRLRRDYPVRFVTNTTSRPHRVLAAHLASLGLLEDPDDLVTPYRSAEKILVPRGLASGLAIADESAAEDLAWFREASDGPTVLLCAEAHAFSIADFQEPFRRLLAGAKLFALQRNRYYRLDGRLVTDVGPVAAFLSYACGCDYETLGKPSNLLFDVLAAEAGFDRERILMVGDDAEFDVAASVRIGMRGILVRTGKYRKGDETRVDPQPTVVLDSVADLPGWLGGPG